MRHDAFFPCAHRKFLERENPPFDLHERHISLQFVDGVDSAAIDIFIWIMLEQFTPRRNAEFLVQEFGAPRSHTRQILDILVEEIQRYVEIQRYLTIFNVQYSMFNIQCSMLDQRFGNSEVERRGDFDVFAVAFDHRDAVAEGFDNGCIVGERFVEGLAISAFK